MYLLGATKYNELVFADIDLKHPKYWNKEKGSYTDKTKTKFTASFCTTKPFNGDDYDLEEYFKELIECYDKEYLYDLCLEYDCKPSDLAGEMAYVCEDVRDVFDCSYYSKCYKINGSNWYFESMSCGQLDTRNEIKETTNPEAYKMLHEIWDKHHLEIVDQDVIDQVEKIKQKLSEVNEAEWITDYINKHVEELD